MADTLAYELDLDNDGSDDGFGPVGLDKAQPEPTQEDVESPVPEPSELAADDTPTEPQTDVTPDPSPGEEDDPQERNWKAMRGVVAEKSKAAEDAERRAQQAEARLLALEAAQRVAQPQPQPAQEQPLPDMNEDPQGYIEARLERERLERANQLANLSEQTTREQLGSVEVDRRMDVYRQLATSDPSLTQRVTSSASPWHTMCSEVKKHEDLQRLGEIEDIDAYKEQIRKEVLAEVAAQTAGAQTPTPPVPPERIPQTLATTPSASPPTPADAVPDDIDEICHGHRGGSPFG